MADTAKQFLDRGDLRGFASFIDKSVASRRTFVNLVIALGTIGCFFGIFDRWWLAKDYSFGAIFGLVSSELMVLVAAAMLVDWIRDERKMRQQLADALWRALGDQGSQEESEVTTSANQIQN